MSKLTKGLKILGITALAAVLSSCKYGAEIIFEDEYTASMKVEIQIAHDEMNTWQAMGEGLAEALGETADTSDFDIPDTCEELFADSSSDYMDLEQRPFRGGLDCVITVDMSDDLIYDGNAVLTQSGSTWTLEIGDKESGYTLGDIYSSFAAEPIAGGLSDAFGAGSMPVTITMPANITETSLKDATINGSSVTFDMINDMDLAYIKVVAKEGAPAIGNPNGVTDILDPRGGSGLLSQASNILILILALAAIAVIIVIIVRAVKKKKKAAALAATQSGLYPASQPSAQNPSPYAAPGIVPASGHSPQAYPQANAQMNPQVNSQAWEEYQRQYAEYQRKLAEYNAQMAQSAQGVPPAQGMPQPMQNTQPIASPIPDPQSPAYPSPAFSQPPASQAPAPNFDVPPQMP